MIISNQDERNLKMTRMTPTLGFVMFGAALAMATPAFAQTASKPTTAPATETRSAKTTANGDTGLFFVPTAEVLPSKKFSFSLYRTNFDDGQGFSDMSNFPVTLGVGIGGHVEAYGAYNVLTRIDRRARPMFFTSTSSETSTVQHALRRRKTMYLQVMRVLRRLMALLG